jgi:hypothetical protein
MPTLKDASAEWLKRFQGVPADLLSRASKPRATKEHPLNPGDLPPGTILVPRSVVDGIFKGTRQQENWAEYRRQFAEGGWIVFSDVMFTEDGHDALVYYAVHCGGLCAEGGYMWLHRDSAQMQWRVAKRIVRWVS